MFKIAFQTLACPDWHWEKIMDEAERLGYDGIELRGVEGEMYLPRARPFRPENLSSTVAELQRRNLEICCLDTSCQFHEGRLYAASICEGTETIDLAQKIGTPYIRIFGDVIPPGSTEEEVIGLVAQGLTTLGKYAETRGVTVLLETHGDINNHRIVQSVLRRTDSAAVGILWDFEHPCLHGEDPQTTWRELGAHIRHTHVKDAYRTDDGKKLCAIGEGEVPIAEILKILRQNGYRGWLSLEYEKKWAPYLDEPEISLPHSLAFLKRVLSEATDRS